MRDETRSEARRPLMALVVLIAVAALVAGCGGGQTDVAAEASGDSGGAGTLRVAMAQAPATIDPATVCSTYDTGLVGALYVRLSQYGVKPGPDGTTQADPTKIEPWLAKSWTISKDELTYTFHLRPGLKFPSGEPLDSDAVKYTFDRLLKMNQCGAYYALDGLFEPPLIKSISAPNPTTVVISLNQPDPNALQAWAQPSAGIVDPSVVEAHGGVKANSTNPWMASHAAPSGPYVLGSYQPNRQAVLEANKDFFEPVNQKQIVINYDSSDSTLLLAARSGEADIVIGLSKQAVSTLANEGCCRVIVNDAPTWEQIGLPNDKPPFNNKKVREALTYAVPYEDIVKNVAFGYAKTYYGPWPPAFPQFDPAVEGARPFDLEKAKALLSESGVELPLDVTLTLTEGNSVERLIATIVQSTWKELGINVKVSVLSAAAFEEAIHSGKAQAFLRYDGPSVLAPEFLWNYDARCKAEANLSHICIPAADALVDELQKTTDPAERQRLATEIAKLWVADSPRIQVYSDRFTAVLGKDVKSYYFSPSDLFYPAKWEK